MKQNLILGETLRKKYDHKMQHCYENAFSLFSKKEVEELHIGYARCFIDKWFWIRHGWGVKDGEIVDSTPLIVKKIEYHSVFKISSVKEMISAMKKTSGHAMLEYDLEKEYEFIKANIEPTSIPTVINHNNPDLWKLRQINELNYVMKKRASKVISIEEYCNSMKTKYKDQLESIDDELLMADSFSRGQRLYDILEGTRLKDELKYYVFLNWWDSIDSCHEKFGDNVKRWLDSAKVKLSFNDLNVDEDGYVKVYRGTNEYSRSWMGMSWTTDKYIALKFAEGARVRRPTQSPAILLGRVHVDQILGMIDSRNESEILCYCVESDGVLYPDSEEYQQIRNGLEEHMAQIRKDTDRQIAEMVENMKSKKEVPQYKNPNPEEKAEIDVAQEALNEELKLIGNGKTDLTRMEELRIKHRNLVAKYCMTEEQKASGDLPF